MGCYQSSPLKSSLAISQILTVSTEASINPFLYQKNIQEQHEEIFENFDTMEQYDIDPKYLFEYDCTLNKIVKVPRLGMLNNSSLFRRRITQ